MPGVAAKLAFLLPTTEQESSRIIQDHIFFLKFDAAQIFFRLNISKYVGKFRNSEHVC